MKHNLRFYELLVYKFKTNEKSNIHLKNKNENTVLLKKILLLS